jgi:hypothetical protein
VLDPLQPPILPTPQCRCRSKPNRSAAEKESAYFRV